MTTPAHVSTCTGCVATSGKGGAGKSAKQFALASAASTEHIPTLFFDLDPERNVTNRFAKGVGDWLLDAPGIGRVLMDAGALTRDEGQPYNVEKAAASLRQSIVPSTLPGVDFVPADEDLQAIGQGQLRGKNWGWLLREIVEAAGISGSYRLMLFDTAGRRGQLVTLAMYASDVAYTVVNDNSDTVTKALEARERVEFIQDAHDIRWAGTILSGIQLTTAINVLNRANAVSALGGRMDTTDMKAIAEWGDIIAEVPYRPSLIHQNYSFMTRISDEPKSKEPMRPIYMPDWLLEAGSDPSATNPKFHLDRLLSDILHKHILADR